MGYYRTTSGAIRSSGWPASVPNFAVHYSLVYIIHLFEHHEMLHTDMILPKENLVSRFFHGRSSESHMLYHIDFFILLSKVLDKELTHTALLV
jgi:hypothetical protein